MWSGLLECALNETARGIRVSLRDKLAERARPYLEPGEQIQAVFVAQSDAWRFQLGCLIYVLSWFALDVALMVFARPWASVFSTIAPLGVLIPFFLLVRLHEVVVTERAIVVLDISTWTHRPTRLRLRHPRDFRFGQLSWRSGSFVLDNTKYGVGRRFHKDVASADAALTQTT
jgi:hypothetical protein